MVIHLLLDTNNSMNELKYHYTHLFLLFQAFLFANYEYSLYFTGDPFMELHIHNLVCTSPLDQSTSPASLRLIYFLHRILHR